VARQGGAQERVGDVLDPLGLLPLEVLEPEARLERRGSEQLDPLIAADTTKPPCSR
jgi:hypothetical protein